MWRVTAKGILWPLLQVTVNCWQYTRVSDPGRTRVRSSVYTSAAKFIWLQSLSVNWHLYWTRKLTDLCQWPGSIMAGVNDGSMQQWLLVKNRRKHQRHRARSRRKLQGIRQVMQSTLLGQFQQLMLSLTLSAAVILSSPLPVTQVVISDFCSRYTQCGSDPCRIRVEPCNFQGLNFRLRSGFFWLFFCSHQPIAPGSTRDVGQTSSSVNMT